MVRILRYLIMSSLPMYKITQTVTAAAAPINFHHFIWSPRLVGPAVLRALSPYSYPQTPSISRTTAGLCQLWLPAMRQPPLI